MCGDEDACAHDTTIAVGDGEHTEDRVYTVRR